MMNPIEVGLERAIRYDNDTICTITNELTKTSNLLSIRCSNRNYIELWLHTTANLETIDCNLIDIWLEIEDRKYR